MRGGCQGQRSREVGCRSWESLGRLASSGRGGDQHDSLIASTVLERGTNHLDERSSARREAGLIRSAVAKPSVNRSCTAKSRSSAAASRLWSRKAALPRSEALVWPSTRATLLPAPPGIACQMNKPCSSDRVSRSSVMSAALRSSPRQRAIGATACARPFLMTLEWVRTPGGWRTATDIALPIPPAPHDLTLPDTRDAPMHRIRKLHESGHATPEQFAALLTRM